MAGARLAGERLFRDGMIDEWRALEAEGSKLDAGDNRGLRARNRRRSAIAPSSARNCTRSREASTWAIAELTPLCDIVAAKASETSPGLARRIRGRTPSRASAICAPDREIEIKAVRLRAVSAEAEAPPIERFDQPRKHRTHSVCKRRGFLGSGA